MSGSNRPFLDTNVIVYLLEGGAKAERSEHILLSGGIVSAQVLQEFVAVARGKLKLDWPVVHEILTAVKANTEATPMTLATHTRAVIIAERHNLHIYDAAIVSSAIDAECDCLFTEDMQHGQKIDGVRIENPYR